MLQNQVVKWANSLNPLPNKLLLDWVGAGQRISCLLNARRMLKHSLVEQAFRVLNHMNALLLRVCNVDLGIRALINNLAHLLAIGMVRFELVILQKLLLLSFFWRRFQQLVKVNQMRLRLNYLIEFLQEILWQGLLLI